MHLIVNKNESLFDILFISQDVSRFSPLIYIVKDGSSTSSISSLSSISSIS